MARSNYLVGARGKPDRILTLHESQKSTTPFFSAFRNKDCKDCHDEIDFQTGFVMDLAAGCDYGYDLDVGDIFHSWEHDKDENILTYRDKSFASKVSFGQCDIHLATHNRFLTIKNVCHICIG